jgi:short-subunit dehydrogenase
MPQTIFITGASSGIGLELARLYATRGDRVVMTARRRELLESEARAIDATAERVMTIACDVGDRAALGAAVQSVLARWGTIDVAIANAGVGITMRADRFRIDDAELMVRTNILGMMYLYAAVITPMVERGRGHFVGIASIAGHRGLPTSSVYSATKAAMQAFLEATRIELAPRGVAVTTVNPGWVDTAMTQKNRFRMPLLMTAERAARIIARGVDRQRPVIEFPLPTSLLMRLLRVVPRFVYDRLTAPYARRKIDSTRVNR